MKKTLLVASGILFSVFAYAGKNGVTELQREKEAMLGKGIISSGFFLNIGLAFPSQTLSPTGYTTETSGSAFGGSSTSSNSLSSLPAEYTNSQSLGVQPSIEIGNQWYFWKNEKMGVGIRVSWFQFGYSSYTSNYGKGTAYQTSQSIVDLRFFKIAPQFTLAIGKEMALDFSIEFAPTIFIGGGSSTFDISGTTYTTAYAKVSAGFLIAPGVKFRFKKFAAGFDFGFGSLPGGGVYTTTASNGSGSTVQTITGSSSTLFPRLYLGFKF